VSEMDLREEAVRDDEAETGADAAGVVSTAEDPEAPEADAVEQRTEVTGTADTVADTTPFEADELDSADQRRVVELDEDDYR
jgi:hypothetical protein